MKEPLIFYPATIEEWREWLSYNHLTESSVWVVFYSKSSGTPSLTWSEAVDVALCFGWIDSKKVKIDSHTSHQFFSKRKVKSTWSRINKEKVAQLIKDGWMQDAGHQSIALAKQNGSWTILDEVEDLIVPADLEAAFQTLAGSKEYYLQLSKSKKKLLLSWIVLAKRSETRAKRIEEIVASLAHNKMPAALS